MNTRCFNALMCYICLCAIDVYVLCMFLCAIEACMCNISFYVCAIDVLCAGPVWLNEIGTSEPVNTTTNVQIIVCPFILFLLTI
jgi:hypothetical protein